MRRARGYILVETLTAMAVLSVTAAVVQQGVYTAVQARGLSQDYTTAQFLMEGIVATAALEPWLAAGDTHAGAFAAPNERFSHVWSVERVTVPMPPLPPGFSPEQRAGFASSFQDSMGRLRVEIQWSRGGQPFSVTGTTLIAPERLWRDPIAGTP